MCPSKYRQVPDDASDIYVQDREMTPLGPIDSTDIQNHNNTSSINAQQHGESNHHNQSSSNQITSSYNQKPYIPGMLIFFFFLEKN